MKTLEMKAAHKEDCKRVFKNYDLTCERCQELKNGAAPREGWNDAKDRAYQQFKRALAAHDCVERKCGPVCVAFDW